jgi:hypothetical protein
MGIQINGQTDIISAVDGSLTISGAELPTVTNLNATGIVTATGFVGNVTGNLSGNLNSTGVSTVTTLRATSIVGVTTAGITTAYVNSINDGPISGSRNRIINGDMRIDARNNGASVTSSGGGTFSVDRFASFASGGGAYTTQRSTDVPTGQGFVNSIVSTVTTIDSPTGSDYYIIQQSIEGFNTADLGWGTASAKPITISFWVKASIAGTYTVAIRNSGNNRSYRSTYSIVSANTWEQKILTVPGDTTGTWITDNGTGIRIGFTLGAGSDFIDAANMWSALEDFAATGQTQWIATLGATFQVTGVQLEPGTVATPFERRSYGQELALCQRYFEIYNIRNIRTSYIAGGYGFHYGYIAWKVIKRAIPTTNTPTVTNYQPGGGTATASCGNITVDGALLNSGSANTDFVNQWINSDTILTISAEI